MIFCRLPSWGLANSKIRLSTGFMEDPPLYSHQTCGFTVGVHPIQGRAAPNSPPWHDCNSPLDQILLPWVGIRLPVNCGHYPPFSWRFKRRLSYRIYGLLKVV